MCDRMPPYVVPSAGPLPAYGFFRRRRLLPLGDARRARSGVFNSFSALQEARGEQDHKAEISLLQEAATAAPAGGNSRRSSRRRRGRRGHGGGPDDAAAARGWEWRAVARFAAAALVLLVVVLFAWEGKRR